MGAVYFMIALLLAAWWIPLAEEKLFPSGIKNTFAERTVSLGLATLKVFAQIYIFLCLVTILAVAIGGGNVYALLQ